MPDFLTTPPIPYVEIGTQAAAVRTAIDAAQLSAANSFGGLQKLAIPGPFATDAEASTGGVPDDNLYYRSDGTVRAASHISLDLAFALDKTLTARTGPTPTFTRSSTATFVGSNGLIQSAIIDAPRFDHDPITGVCKGLLIEEPRTNYLIHSQDFQNWNSNINVVSRNKELSIADPSGGFTSNRIVANTSWSVYRDQVANGAVPNGVHSVSIFARAVTGGFNILTLTGSSVNVRVNLELGTVLQSSGTTGTALVTQFGPIGADGFRWYRISYVPVDTTSEAIYLESAAFTGTRDICLVWGAQFEVGASATSYIPTIPAEAARSADVCSIIGADFSNVWNTTEGSTLVNGASMGPATTGIFGAASFLLDIGSSSSDRLTQFVQLDLGKTRPQIRSANVTIYEPTLVNYTANTTARQSLGFKVGETTSAYLNNVAYSGGTNLSLVMPVATGFYIGSSSVGGNRLNGHIARIQYFRKRLSNAKLQTLTTP